MKFHHGHLQFFVNAFFWFKSDSVVLPGTFYFLSEPRIFSCFMWRFETQSTSIFIIFQLEYTLVKGNKQNFDLGGAKILKNSSFKPTRINGNNHGGFRPQWVAWATMEQFQQK